MGYHIVSIIFHYNLLFGGIFEAVLHKSRVGGLEHLDYFPFHIWDVILPIDELILLKMVIAPPTRSRVEIPASSSSRILWSKLTVSESGFFNPLVICYSSLLKMVI